jgi:predicted MPP superfamily phosphohydrolase
MQLRWLIFVGVLTLVLGGATTYVLRRVLQHWTGLQNHSWLVVGAGVSFVLLQVLGPYLYRAEVTPLTRPMILQWVTYVSLGVFFCLIFYMAVTDLGGALLAKVLKFFDVGSSELPTNLARRGFLGATLAAGLTGVAGVVQAIRGPVLEEVEVPLSKLPKSFQGYTIVQISDLHVGPTIGREYVEGVVALANAQNPDAIVVTGDLVDGKVRDLREEVGILRGLKAKDGIFYCTGNHECYWGVAEWKEFVAELGWKTLSNGHVLIQRELETLVVGGLPDPTEVQTEQGEAPSVQRAFQGVDPRQCRILLVHQPKFFEEAYQAGVDLQLSGHTHAGQFFPFSLLVRFVHRYYRGLNRHESMWVYVNRATGYWGPPLRFANSAEITKLILKSTQVV